MARTMTPGTDADVQRIGHAMWLLREARKVLKAAGARTSAKKVARALKSADGARRHARHRALRTELGEL